MNEHVTIDQVSEDKVRRWSRRKNDFMFKRNIERLERKIAFFTELANGWFTQEQITALKLHHMAGIHKKHWIRRSYITHTLTVEGQKYFIDLKERLARLKEEWEESKKRLDDKGSKFIREEEVAKILGE